MAVFLDDDEQRLLQAYETEDANGELWICPWAIPVRSAGPAMDMAMAMAVARRLCQRKLLMGDEDRRKTRGYAITAKGKAALA